MAVLDLERPPPGLFLTASEFAAQTKAKGTLLQTNVASLARRFGKRFDLRMRLSSPGKQNGGKFLFMGSSNGGEVATFPVQLRLAPALGGLEHYVLTHDYPGRTHFLFPMKLVFVDAQALKHNDNAYLSNINRTDKHSGTDMVQLAVAVSRLMGVRVLRLYDEASVRCDANGEEYDLSYLKLLERGATFYMKLGFEFDDVAQFHDVGAYDTRFPSSAAKTAHVASVVRRCRAVRTGKTRSACESLMRLVGTAIARLEYTDIRLFRRPPGDASNVYEAQVDSNTVMYLYQSSRDVIEILRDRRGKPNEFLYQVMVQLFGDKELCDAYKILEDRVANSHLYKVEYAGTSVVFDFLDCFRELMQLRQGVFRMRLRDD